MGRLADVRINLNLRYPLEQLWVVISDGQVVYVLKTAKMYKDPYGRKIFEWLKTTTTGPTTDAYALTQYSYDDIRRLECTAVRMTKSNYSTLPAATCEQPQPQAEKIDRISRTIYEFAGLSGVIQTGVGATLERNETSIVHNMNGQTTRVTDANGNKTSYAYDGHMRLIRTCYNSDVTACQNGTAGDVVQLNYGTTGTAKARVAEQTLRGHPVSVKIGYTYNTLGRVTNIAFPSGQPNKPIAFDYDLLGNIKSAIETGTGRHAA